jgi:D-alanine-D-alanine ligase
MRIRLGVLFGGKSVEHEVSIISALQAIQNLNREKYEVIPIYMTKSGRFHSGELLLDISNYKDLDQLLKNTDEVILYNNGVTKKLISISSSRLIFRKNTSREIDVILPVVHGTNVEDGALQGYLRTLQIPFAECDVLASALGMDKSYMKMVLVHHSIPVLPFVSFDTSTWLKDPTGVIKRIEEGIGYPVIIKPADLGSSIGIKPADDREQLIEGINYARQYTLKILVEKRIVKLKEINCAVLGDREIQQTSSCERPISKNEILSFSDKYLNDSKQKGMSGLDRELPAKIETALEEKICRYAKETFKALDCNGVARIDFMIDQECDKVYVNEINTIPGSMAFYLFEPKGKSYTELLDEVIGLAMKRERENMSIDYEYRTDILTMKRQRGKKI